MQSFYVILYLAFHMALLAVAYRGGYHAGRRQGALDALEGRPGLWQPRQ